MLRFQVKFWTERQTTTNQYANYLPMQGHKIYTRFLCGIRIVGIPALCKQCTNPRTSFPCSFGTASVNSMNQTLDVRQWTIFKSDTITASHSNGTQYHLCKHSDRCLRRSVTEFCLTF